MPPTDGVHAASAVVVGSPSEFSKPKNQSVFEHTPVFQILDEGGHRLIHALDAGGMGTLEVVVTVPTTRENLHEADPLLHQSASHQALFAEFGRLLLVQAVGVFCLSAFTFQIDHSGNFHLHAVGELVALHAGLEFIVLWVSDHVDAD